MSRALFVIFGCWQSGTNKCDGVSGDIVKKLCVYLVATWVGSLELLNATWSQ